MEEHNHKTTEGSNGSSSEKCDAFELASLKKQVEEQSDEIVVLKSALADALRRVQVLEGRKHSGASGRPRHSTPSSANHTPGKSTSHTKKSEKSSRSPTNSFASPPARPTSKHHFADTTHKKGSSVKRKASNSGLSKEELAERDAAAVKFQLRGRTLNFYPPGSFNEADQSGNVPDKKLHLEWVYGYRGKDCRNNLYCLPSNEIVFNTAAVVVLYNPISKTQRHYTEHTDDVKCLALHPSNEIVASGQVAGHAKKDGKPHIRIWNVSSLQTLKVIGLGSFQRGLCCIAFSVADGGEHVVAVDDGNDHSLSVWEWDNKKKIAEAKGGNEPVLAADFYPADSKRLVTCGKSHIAFWKLNGDKKMERKMGVFEKHPKPKYVLCFAFGRNGEVISGDSNGNIFIWGYESNQISQEITAAHEGPVFSIETSGDGMFLSGGGKDRKVYLWDSNYNKSERQIEIPEESGAVRSAIWGPKVAEERSVVIGTTKNCILQTKFEDPEDKQVLYLSKGHSEEVWGLSVHPFKPLFVTCAYDKMLFLWNSEEKSLVWAKQLEDALQSACFHPNGDLLAVATQNNKFGVLSAESGDEFFKCEIGSEQHDCIKYSPDGSYLALGSHDNFIYLFTVSEDGKQYKKHGRLSGHSSYITHLDWSKDNQYLQSNSGDYEILYFSTSLIAWLLVARSSVQPAITVGRDSIFHTGNHGFHSFQFWALVECNPSPLAEGCGFVGALQSEIDREGFELIPDVSLGQAKDCKQVSSAFSMRDIEWETWSCVLGFPVQGMWPEGADGTDINTCIRSHSAHYLVNGDDSGSLNIFTYPCSKPKSTPNVSRGHSSHVTAVSFLATDSHVISTGGKDNTVMQWKVES